MITARETVSRVVPPGERAQTTQVDTDTTHTSNYVQKPHTQPIMNTCVGRIELYACWLGSCTQECSSADDGVEGWKDTIGAPRAA
eukprot:720504-Amorphochlora_amoeboformis.AAC.1